MPLILAIESSCDETACAVCRDGAILSNIIANQTIHEQYGGVVPELASRAHLQNIVVPVVDAALKKAVALTLGSGSDPGSATGFGEGRLGLSSIDAIAFTQSPGLIGSLLVRERNLPNPWLLSLGHPALLAVHHMRERICAG